MVFEKEATSIKDKIIRFFVGLFLFILVGMLIITLLPGDLETGFSSILSGRDESKAGEIGKISIPMDYFNAARRECYYRYKNYAPSMADDAETINTCAYQLVRNLKISGMMAEAAGFTVSEMDIKLELSDQARQIYRESSSAGYSADEVNSPDEIYKQLFRTVPFGYRIDASIAGKLFESFLKSSINKSDSEASLEEESRNARLTLNILTISDEALLNRFDNEITISEEEIKKEFEKTAKDNPDKKLENERNFIYNKLKALRKKEKMAEFKTTLKSEAAKGTLSSIAAISGGKTETINGQSLNSLWALQVGGGKIELGKNNDFLKDITEKSFGQGKIGGPYTFSDKTLFVEFSGLDIQNQANKAPVKRDDNAYLVNSFLFEINQSLSEQYPIKRNMGGNNAN